MARVFLSFHNDDTSQASALADHLATRGHEVIRFDQNVAAGQRWEEQLGRELRDADAIVILLTEASSHSQWVMHEAGMAIGYARERGRPIVLPVALGEVQIPGPLKSIQAIISRDKNTQEVAEQVDRVLQSQVGRLRAREEQKREVAERVATTANDYIRRSRQELAGRESRYRQTAYFWYAMAFVSLALGGAFAIWRAVHAASIVGWLQLSETIALGLVVVGLLVALSKLAFSLGKAFMVESLRNADRSHAISFGEFYLNAFGEHAAWAEVKEAFQHWNVDKGSSFAAQDAKEYDPQLMQLAIEIAKNLRTPEEPKKK